jgi:hypothetical protein
MCTIQYNVYKVYHNTRKSVRFESMQRARFVLVGIRANKDDFDSFFVRKKREEEEMKIRKSVFVWSDNFIIFAVFIYLFIRIVQYLVNKTSHTSTLLHLFTLHMHALLLLPYFDIAVRQIEPKSV